MFLTIKTIKMDCQLCQKELDAYCEGKLPRDMRVQVDVHLKVCKECSESYRLQILADNVINREKELLSNQFLSTRVMAQIENIENQSSKTIPAYGRVLRMAVISISLAAAIFLGVMMGKIYNPAYREKGIPVELALMDDATIESLNMLSNE